jgi:site-specific DNA-cytosine methylase
MDYERLHRAPILGDIRDVDETMLANLIPANRTTVLVTAGFPCQDISKARVGAQGIVGEKSGLFFQVLRILDIIRKYHDVILILENSSNITKENMGLDRIITEIVCERSMWFRWMKSCSGEVGAFHHRRRWFAIGGTTAICDDVRMQFVKIGHRIGPDWTENAQPHPIMRRIEPVGPVRKILRALGNAVVPRQCRNAVSILLNDVYIAENTKATERPSAWAIHMYKPDNIAPTIRNRKIKEGPFMLLQLQQPSNGIEQFTKKRWPTPVATRIVADWLTPNYGPNLPTAIFYSQYSRRIVRTDNPREINSNWMQNPYFVCWLMGYNAAHINILEHI